LKALVATVDLKNRFANQMPLLEGDASNYFAFRQQLQQQQIN
jgi:hypothetical protein